MSKKKSKAKVYFGGMVFEADVFIESCLDKEGTEVAVSIFGSPDPSEDFDRLTAEGFKLDLTTGIYHRNP